MRTQRLALLSLAVLAVGAPLAALAWGPRDALLGYCGVARGEFENWAWLDWWIPRYAACLLQHAVGVSDRLGALLALPRDLDIGNYLDGILITLPLKALLGAVGGHDVRVAVVLLLNAAAAWFACREAVRAARPQVEPDGAALVCAVALACNPLTLWDVAESRFAQALIAPALAYMGCLLRWSGAPSTRSAAWCGVWLATSALVYWFQALFLAPLALLALAWAPRAWRGWTLHLVVAAAITLPFALPFAFTDRPHPAPGTAFPPISSLAIPAPGVLGPPGPGLVVAQSVDLARPLTPPLGPSLPWIWLVLGALSLPAWRGCPRVAVALTACAVGWWAFSLGPYLRWQGDPVGDGWLYCLFYRVVPFGWRLNWPARTLPLLMAALTLLAAPALAPALARVRRGGAATAAALAAVTLTPAILAGLVPLPVSPLTVPAAYRQAALGDPREGVVELMLPLNSGAAGWYQSWHGHPLLGGQAFCPPALSDWPPQWARDPAGLQEDALLDWVEAARRGAALQPWPAAAASRLREASFPWLVVQRTYAGQVLDGSGRAVDALTRVLGRPDVEDAAMSAWRLR